MRKKPKELPGPLVPSTRVWEFGGPGQPVWVYVLKSEDRYQPWSGGCGIGIPVKIKATAIGRCIRYARARLRSNIDRCQGKLNELNETLDMLPDLPEGE